MKKLAIVLSLISLSIYLSYSLLAVPEGKHIWLEKDLNNCFHRNEDNSFKIKWSTNIYDQNKDESWAPVDQGKNNEISKIEINPNNAIYNLSATSGECLVQVNEPGEYTINVTIVYKEQSNGFTTSVNKVLYVNFYEVKRFEPEKRNKLVNINEKMHKTDFVIDVHPSNGEDLFVWSIDDLSQPGKHKAYLKLNDHPCSETELTAVKVFFSKEVSYVPESLEEPSDVTLFNAYVEPFEDDIIDQLEFKSFIPGAGVELKAYKGVSDSCISFVPQKTSEGYIEFDFQAIIKASHTECASTKIIKVALEYPSELELVNGKSQVVKFKTIPVLNDLSIDLDTNDQHIAVFDEETREIQSRGNREVFKDVVARDKATANFSGEVILNVGEDEFVWSVDILTTVTNAPPKFLGKSAPNLVAFNVSNFDTVGKVRYTDIDDNAEDYKRSISNVKNNGADRDAIIKTIISKAKDIANDEIEFEFIFETNDGIKIYRNILSTNFTIGAGFLVVQASGDINLEFQVPISENSRFLVNPILDYLFGGKISTVAENIINKITALFQLGSINQKSVKFIPSITLESGKNKIEINDGPQGLAFESKEASNEKIVISINGIKNYY